MSASEIRPGDKFVGREKSVTVANMVEFERIVWDRGLNVHNDAPTARQSGLSAPIASGQFQMAILHELLEGAFGDGWKYGGSITARWIRPVRDGDTITAHGSILDIVPAGRLWRKVSLDVWCSNQSGHKTGVGTAYAYIPDVSVDGVDPQSWPVDGRSNPPSAGALSGVRVLELTHAWAGPYCGMMLGDMGADVIKIERPSQDPESRGGFPYAAGESVPFMMLHRNKQSMTLDLKSERGRELFLELANQSDVVIQNFRPGVATKLGVGYGDLRRINPAIIYASISGYGTWGPYADRPGVNMIAQAASGLTATTMVDGRPPIPMGTALCDIIAAMWAGYGIVAALHERDRTGRGQHIDSSLVEAGLSLMLGPMAAAVFAEDDAADYGGTDGNAPSGFFETSDGVYVAVFASYPALWKRFVGALGLEHLVSDERFATREARTENAGPLHQLLRSRFKSRPRMEWVEILEDAGVPVAPVEGVGRVLAGDHIRERGVVAELLHPRAGLMPLLRLPARLSETPGMVDTAAPLLGEHTDSVLRGLGLDSGEVDRLRSAGVV